MTVKDYNLNWSEYFQLDDTSPSGLVRIKSKWGNTIEKCYVGTRNLSKNGDNSFWALGFKGKMYLVHRIIWVMTYGSIDSSLVIDHLDGNPFNNKIENLSLKTQKDNLRNRKQGVSNKTGVTGVKLMTDGDGYWYYEANWYDHTGFQKSKCFSLLKFGDAAAKNLAIAYREKQIAQLISEGLDYTKRHGTKEIKQGE